MNRFAIYKRGLLLTSLINNRNGSESHILNMAFYLGIKKEGVIK